MSVVALSEPVETIERYEIVQIVPGHKWGGCLAVIDEVKPWGCQAYLPIPGGDAYIRLAWEEFERIKAKVIFVADEVAGE